MAVVFGIPLETTRNPLQNDSAKVIPSKRLLFLRIPFETRRFHPSDTANERSNVSTGTSQPSSPL